MPTLGQNPAFIVYALTACALCLNLLVLWAMTGAARAKTGVTPNEEDAKNGRVSLEEPASVARAMRVYQNAAANILPFLILGFLYVLLGASAGTAAILFGVFTGARILHAIFYRAGKQPYRTLIFVVAQLATLGVMVQVVRLSVASL